MQKLIKHHIIKIIIALLVGLSGCNQVTIKLNKVPANTPPGSKIYVAGNFNFWDPGDERYVLDYDKKHGYSISLPVFYGTVEYKFTRGDWSTVERDRCGNDIKNRVINNSENEVSVGKIESWADLDPLECDSLVLIVTKLPKNTPKNAEIRIAGNFNAWNPATNQQYILKRDSKSGVHSVVLRKRPGLLLKDFRFKIVRNNITESEADKYGNELEPRRIEFSKTEKMEIAVENWTDLVDPTLNTVTIVLKRIPKNTPANSQIFLVGNFNNWMPGDKKYIFRKNANGLYSISIPRLKYGLSFKITRGSWAAEAADKKGNIFGNSDYNYNEVDTIYFEFDNWKDIAPFRPENITFIIDKVPQNTPPSQDLWMSLSLYEWNSNQKQYVFEKLKNGKYVLDVKRPKSEIKYKITRGSWKNQEILNTESRTAFPFDDTIKIEIAGWSDLLNPKTEFIRIEIPNIPKNTNPDAQIFISGGFNAWEPGNIDFKLKKDSRGVFFIDLPRVWLKQGFKFTQGSWGLVEGNKRKNFRENRYYNGNASLLSLEIESWEN